MHGNGKFQRVPVAGLTSGNKTDTSGKNPTEVNVSYRHQIGTFRTAARDSTAKFRLREIVAVSVRNCHLLTLHVYPYIIYLFKLSFDLLRNLYYQ